jgi:hypothetical protein
MITRFPLLAAIVLSLTCVGRAAAQPASSPDPPHAAISAALGGDIPFGRKLDNAPLFAAAIDACFGSHVSLRAELGAGFATIDRRGFEHDRRPTFADLDLVFRWQREAWQPYIAFGAGLYEFRSRVKSETMRDGRIRDELIALGFDPGDGTQDAHQTDRALGGNAGLGVEYLLTPRTTVFADLRYHRVGDVTAIASFNGSFVGFSVGARKYF